MKQLHRKDLFGWSEFNKERNLDFHSVLWVREGGNVPCSAEIHSTPRIGRKVVIDRIGQLDISGSLRT